MINEKEYTEADVFHHNEQWHSFDAHSRLSHTDKEHVLNSLNTSIKETYRFLKEASHVILTLGTSWIYRDIASDRCVANCHKLPQKKFLKELYTVDQIKTSLEAIDALIRSVNPGVTIINTVSPVRHIKDGFVENNVSKAHLISAVNEMCVSNKAQFYFPSYELMMDELRDYRFYAEDMLHPNEVAINHIWDRFKTVWISEEAFDTLKEIDGIQKGIAHRPFHPNSNAHQSFLDQLELRKTQIISRFPHVTF